MQAKKIQSGFLLLEALIAILIFSIGILGLVALQAMVIKETSEAQYRTEASMYANQLIGQMWSDLQAANTAAIATDFASPDGTRYQAWRDEVIRAASANSLGGLPGAASNPPTVVFGANNQVTISIFWKQPGNPMAHQFVTTTQIQ